MPKFFAYLCFIVLPLTALGQQQYLKTYPLPEGTLLQVNTDHFASVTLHTGPGKALQLQTSLEGEYQQAMWVEVVREGSTLKVAARQQPSFHFPNDKLGAHKVIAMDLHIRLPAHRSVELYGRSSNVFCKGRYQQVAVTLSDGRCELEVKAASVRVHTGSGNIVLYAPEGGVEARSSYGKTPGNDLGAAPVTYRLTSVTGDILIVE